MTLEAVLVPTEATPDRPQHPAPTTAETAAHAAMPRPADWSQRHIYAMGGLVYDAVNLAEAAARVEHAVEQRERLFISTPNVNFMMAAQQDADFRRSVLLSDLVLPDGMPLVWLARLLKLPVKGRVSGSDLFEHLAQHAKAPIKVFFFGGPDGVAALAAERLNARPGARMRAVGALSPGFGSMDDLSTDAILAEINRSGADFLVVALGAKRGQEWIMRNLPRLAVPAVSHLGAVVNFQAGSVRRAPQWVGALGMEWVWRIREEPLLWKRYAVDAWQLWRSLWCHGAYLVASSFGPACHDNSAADRGTTPNPLQPFNVARAFTLRLRAHSGPKQSPLAIDLRGLGRVDAATLAWLSVSEALSSELKVLTDPQLARAFHWAGMRATCDYKGAANRGLAHFEEQ